MLTRIVQPSPALESFLDSLHLALSRPQRDHLLDLADGVVVCDESKTLAALQRQFLDTSDPANWADFLRISPWSADGLRDRLRRQQFAWLLAEAQQRGLPKVLFLNLDDSLGKKDKQTHCLEPVDWFHDHNESTPQKPRYHKAFCYLECTARVGNLTATLDLRLYLRAKTVRRLNRHRPAGQRLSFRSKNALACAMLNAPEVLIADELTGSFDLYSRHVILRELADFLSNGGACVWGFSSVELCGHMSRVGWLEDGRLTVYRPGECKELWEGRLRSFAAPSGEKDD
jgi:hypothetical protein